MPQYDLVVLGTTGFVGQILCQYLLQQITGGMKWAIAGRSRAKLAKLITSLGQRAANLPYLIADVTDEASLHALCAKTQVVISTVGPYALYGEPLIKICASTGTDYCDLTGEPQWIRRMIQSYEPIAQSSGARIIHCCGFDSIPSDLGVYYLQQQARQQFGQPCDRVKMRVQEVQGGISGGTAASGINLIKEAITNPELRQELANPYSLCPESKQSSNDPPTLIPVQYDEDFQGWVSPFVMAEVNTRIVLRSNTLLDCAYGPHFHYDEAIFTGSGVMGWMTAQGLKLGLDGTALAVALPPTRWLLENTLVPKSGQGPSQTVQEQGFYALEFYGVTATGKKIQVKVTGDRDPGYGSTAKILGQVGLCLAQDFPKSAKAGGFWTPASMFGKTLIARLEQFAGLTFQRI
ncbi:MAG: saccharopine dehydrogenase NADP-binding domain-containing protein [Cyanobacteria bacterium P01_A01_bin.123]